MSICVNTSTKEFKDTARRLDIHPSELELIVHKFINMEGRENHFPSDREIMQELSNDSFTVSQTQQQLYEQRGYASPRRFSSLSHASSFVEELKSFFPNASTSIHRKFNGEYEVTMGKPEVGNPMKELQASLTQALRGRRAGDADINRQLVSLMRSTGITVLGRQEMINFLRENSRAGVQEAMKGTQLDPNINAFIGKKARTRFEQQLHKYRPDMTEQEIQATLDFLHSLSDTKENAVYIKAAIQWIVNKSIILPQDHEKVLQIFTEARKRRIDIMKYKTFGELVSSDEMKPKEKNRPTFNPDEAKTFSNKRTVTTKGGREFTVYDVEDTAEGQREVCRALAAHYEVSPWCLSTFTATGEPTSSAKMHWDMYNGIPRKIAFENGVPVAFSSDTPIDVNHTTHRSIDNIEIKTFDHTIWLDDIHDLDYYNRTKDRAHIVTASTGIVIYETLDVADIGKEQAKKWVKEGVLLPEYITADSGITLYVLSEKGVEKSKKVEVQEKEDREYWWDMSDTAHSTLSDDIKVNGGTRSEINVGLVGGDIDAMMVDWEALTQEDMGLGPEEPAWIDVDGSLEQEEENARIIREEQEYTRIITEMQDTVFYNGILPPTTAEDIIRVFYNYRRYNTLESFNSNLRRLQQDYLLSERDLEQLSHIINARTLEETRAVISELSVLPFFLTPEGEMYGFVDKEGQIYLDETIITPEHPIHEYTHLWDRVVAQRNPELWKRGVELMKQTSLWKEVLESEQYGKKWQRMSSMTPEKLESLIASEVHARLTGERGLQMIDTITAEKGSENIVGKLKQWILDFWKALAQTFGKWDKNQLDSLTIEDFSKLTIRDFVEGVNLNQIAERQTDSQQTSKVGDNAGTAYTNHSGGAVGSDSYWGEVGERYGVKSNHYYHGRPTAKGNVEITQAEFEEGKERVMKANESLHRGGNIDRYMDLLARNWMQVKNADSVFAVGHIVREGEHNSRGYRVTSTQVNGGTGWAVQMAIDAGKPVYVYDQVAKSWYTYTNGDWVETGTPTLTQNFAGIGTREITQDGKNAIEQVYENTFNRQHEAVDVLSISTKTADFGVVINPNLIAEYKSWLESNPTGIVAYRVNRSNFNTKESVERGIIGNPFDWRKHGAGRATQMFYEWLTTGNNFGEELATETFRQAIIDKILSSDPNTQILYYKELGRTSHATIIGYLIANKNILHEQRLAQQKTIIEDLQQTLGAGEQAMSEITDTIVKAKEGVSLNEVSPSNSPFFTKDEIHQIKQALNGRRLFVKSVSRQTDPAFFANEIINFLEANSKKAFTDPTRVNAIEIWTKHDGLPIKRILDACKKYRVAPMVSFSITGLGATALEGGVMKYQDLLDRIGQLIENGTIDPSTTTVRIDPILVGVTDMNDIRAIVNTAKSLGIKKFVTSLVQSYGYTEGTPNDRKVVSGINSALAREGKTYDWDKYYGRDSRGKINFKPKQEYINQVGEVLLELNKDSGIAIETCSFLINGLKASACLDPMIIERVTGIDVTRPDGTYDRDTSRPDCMCYGCHGDMFKFREKQCFSSCAYCYAAHSADNRLNYYNEDGTLKDNDFTRTEESRTLPIVTNDKKVIAKAKTATKFIGHAEGVTESETTTLLQQMGSEANPGKYTSKDKVFVSIVDSKQGEERVRSEQQQKTVAESLKALSAGATLITSPRATINQADSNNGEKVLMNALIRNGATYSERIVEGQRIGVWHLEERTTINQEGNPVSVSMDPKLEEYFQKQQILNAQLKALMEDSRLSSSELREIADQVVWWISDHITELINNKELRERDYKGVLKDMDISTMSRAAIVKAIGVQNLVEHAKLIFSPSNNQFNSLSQIAKAASMIKNWNALMILAQTILLENEGFSIVENSDGMLEIEENIDPEVDNFNESQDEADLKETVGDLQEHWQIENRTIDVLTSASRLVKKALNECYLLDEKGQPQVTEWGIKKRLNAREATQSILRWTRGSITLEDMVSKLQKKAAEHTWLNPIIQRLMDTEGKESDFKSQFFSAFCKHFQSYSIVIKDNNGNYKSIPVNEHPALTEAMLQVTSQYQAGLHPLMNPSGINEKSYNQLVDTYNDLVKERKDLSEENFEEHKEKISRLLGYVSNLLGYYVTPEIVSIGLDKEAFDSMFSALGYIVKSLYENKNTKSYDPFNYKGKGSIRGSVQRFLKPITEYLEDTAVSSVYDSGKMYQSYVTPSYLTKLMQKFNLEDTAYDSFLMEEFGQTEFLHVGNDVKDGWRTTFFRKLATDENARKLLAHKVQLNFDKKLYMKEMSDVDYILSFLSEYWSEGASEKESRVPAWFRVPMMSNKPSSEYIKFYSYRGINYKDSIADQMYEIFLQELSRIQTVNMRGKDKTSEGYIKNLDDHGNRFHFLDFMNEYLTGTEKDSELGRLIASKLKGEEVNDTRLTSLTQEVIKNTMEGRVESIINQWTALGVLEAAHSIEGIGANIRESLENFIWNDTLMAMNIMQLTITDPAFYANAEDLQKRLAQIHSPGIRGDVFATDYNGVRVSDGKVRTIYLTDFKGVVSNVIDNLTVLFDRKIANAKSEAERESYRMLKEHLVGENGQYRDINVTDGQAYNSITSYRKKAYIFGKWSPQAEELYQKIRKGTYDYADLQTAFQPMKPFVYSTPMVSSDAPGAPISKFKVPVQNKNSEYLLIMADALLQGESTGLPNALRAIYEVMEKSHYDADGNYKQDGIDTVQFGSAVKSGLGGEINIAQFIEGGTTEDIVRTLKEAIYSAPNVYNKNIVKEMAFEDYSLQQEVPEHFKNHFQLHGSQARYIITSELETVTPEGDPVTYMCEGKPMSASEFRQEYENTIAENIKESIQELITELKLDSFNPIERNIAISKILQREILSSPRYGVDLLLACSLDENGQFRIPLGDPVQSKRVEQLLNSVIKNRINKQKIKGGPVVQVSNFGTSKRLNIRFKDKSGNLLMTREEFAKSNKEGTYENYLSENQAGIAYFEVFAPIQSSELFKEFADSRGFIDVKTIEQISPELLKMIGYRIPTEGKFSITPMKIVGFLPREAGDAIMMPYDMTTINGSDFDVDKMYLMIKELDIATRFVPKKGETMSEAEEDYFKHNVTSIKRHLLKTVDFTPVITKTQRAQILERVEANITNRINAENRRHEEELSKIEDRFEQLESAEDEITYSDNEDKDAKIYNRRAKRVSKEKKLAIKKENDRHDKALRHLDKAKENAIQRELERQKERNKKNTVDAFLRDGRYRSSENDTKLGRALRRAYIDYMYHVITPGTGRAYRNNKIFDMTFEVLTHETSVLEMFNPQGFDPEKKMGYMVAAYRNPANNYTWEQLQNMSIKELKALNERGKNLAFIDVHTQFYKQNAAAGSLIATFAVHRTAHAVLEGDSFFVDVSEACNVNEPFIIAGKEFSGMMKVDPRYNDFGELVGRGLGRLVGSAADAVKDPILNLMNINQNTSHILTTLIRLGMPFEKASLLLSGRVVSRVLATYYKESLLGSTSLNAVIRNAIKDIEERNNIASNSPLYKEELTEEELIRGIKYSSDEIELKTLLALSKIIKLSDAIKLSTFATRYNSISNAVGPLIVDNLISETKRTYLDSDSKLYEQHTMADGKVTYEQAFVDTILERHPILQQFARSYEEAQKVFRGMPANSVGFRTLLGYCRDTTLLKTFASNRKLMTALSDFYQTYLAIEGNIVDGSKLPYYIHEFPQEFINIKNKGDYADNFLIQSITYNTSKQGRLYLRVNSTGMEASVRQKLSAAWEDLHKRNPELSTKLFEYCFFRGGMGFSPLTFMNLIPIQVKEQIPHYLDTYRRLPETSPAHVLDLFIRHNTGEKSLVPTKKIGKSESGQKAIPLYPDRQRKGFYVIPPSATEAINEMRKVRYFKFKTTETSQDEKGMTIKSERTVVLRFVEENSRGLFYREVSPLGNNNEYFELSTSPIEKSMEDFEIEADTSRDSEIEKHTTGDTAEDIVTDNDSPVEMSQQELNETLLRVFQASNMSTFAAAQRILNIKNMDAEAKARYREGYMRYIEKRLQELGITYNHDLVIKLLDEIC